MQFYNIINVITLKSFFRLEFYKSNKTYVNLKGLLKISVPYTTDVTRPNIFREGSAVIGKEKNWKVIK